MKQRRYGRSGDTEYTCFYSFDFRIMYIRYIKKCLIKSIRVGWGKKKWKWIEPNESDSISNEYKGPHFRRKTKSKSVWRTSDCGLSGPGRAGVKAELPLGGLFFVVLWMRQCWNYFRGIRGLNKWVNVFVVLEARERGKAKSLGKGPFLIFCSFPWAAAWCPLKPGSQEVWWHHTRSIRVKSAGEMATGVLTGAVVQPQPPRKAHRPQ